MTLPLSIITPIGQAIQFSPGLPVALISFQLQGTSPFYAQSDNSGHMMEEEVPASDQQMNNIISEQKTGELIIESLDMLSRYLTDHNGLNPADHERGARTEILLLQHIHHPSPPTLKQLAKFAGTNEKKLEDIFRCRHGITVYDFFQNARMKIIHRKLTETAIPLQDLAEEFGYTDYSSFSYAVKKRFSAGPRELRKNSNLV